MTVETGESARLLQRFGRRCAAALRVITLLPIATIALLRAAPPQLAATALIVAVVLVWTCVYGWWLLRRHGQLLVAVDVALLLGVALTVFWTDAVADANFGWMRLLVTFACVTYQWHTSVLVGVLAAVVADGGLLVVATVAGADGSVVRALYWVLVATVLSRGAWVLVRRAAKQADRLADEAAEARREALVAAAVRAEERELANALHDTAATTLLMVGMGQVHGSADWLAAQAHRDLDRLATYDSPPPANADLVALLRTDLAEVRLSVEFDLPAQLPLPFAVARAIADAAAEALNNVRRHAGTERAVVRLRGDSRRLRLEIADDGAGFSADGIAATRRGLRESVRGRMSGVGGRATISSSVGEGTIVRLEWGDDRE
ncbi:Signal transduction histidine kinase [Amycolatopsis marina]|uniref:Signal transduction histidine kinase n=1 Tax=Amycolatopsis marina TaxID=490629 RepID=A0A1I1B0R2_9PSEU|nr:sensor histidine kinase [Amycolatopsis marina]SFB43677.1 Signal transduction histidine kinase [Amycolatopsis marina]